MNPAYPSRYAWTVVALLLPVALLNYLDRQMLAAMKFSVMAAIPDIGSEANWGFLPAAFKWVYAFLSPVGGFLADRFGRRKVIGMSLFVWSAVTWATGHVHTFDQMIVTRALMGISEACYIPAALALIVDFHPGPTRSRAIGIHQMAIYIGIMIGGFSGYVADQPNLGWRFAFETAGAVGVLYAIPLFFLLRDPPRPAIAVARSSVVASVGELFSNRYFILMVLYFTLPALAGWIVKDWMPAILKQQFAIGQGKAGVSATLFVNVASLIGTLTGGWLADRWMRRSERGRINVSALGVCCLVPALFGVGNAGSLGVAVAFLMLFGLGWGFYDCNHMPILCQIVRPGLRATGYGFMNLVSISCGAFFFWVMLVVLLNIIFGVFASACIISIGLILMIKPREPRFAEAA